MVERKRERNVRVFSRGKTSRVVARLVNTRHPSTVDWGVNLPSKYIYISIYTPSTPRMCQVETAKLLLATRMQPPIHWLRHHRLNWFQTNLEILGICSTFWTFSICIPFRPFLSHPFIPIPILLFALCVSPAVFDFLDAIEPLPEFPRNRRKLTFRTREISSLFHQGEGMWKFKVFRYVDVSKKIHFEISRKFCNWKVQFLNFIFRKYFLGNEITTLYIDILHSSYSKYD